ncbi:MAG TPA: response regulator [Thermoanaerobaculia bacterium]|jgi:CheY-like chemotaxis protein
MSDRGKVLVVDDDSAIRALVSRVLRRATYAVAEASNGLEALQKLRAEPYDTVVLDLMMPVMSGYEVVRYLETHDDAGVPCIIIMSAAAEQALEDARSANVHALIRKPFELDTLLAALEQCTREHGGSATTADDRSG